MPTQNSVNDLDQMLHYTERTGTLSTEKNSIKRALDILLQPHQTWCAIAQEEGGLKEAFLPYAVLIGFVPMLISTVISSSLLGALTAMYAGPQAFLGLPASLLMNFIYFGCWMVALAVIAKIVELMAPSFGMRQSWVLSARALVYGSTPSFAVSVISWIPLLGWLMTCVAMIWSVVLVLQGFKVLLRNHL